MDCLEQPQLRRTGSRRESLVHKDVHGIGMIHCHEPQLVEISGFPQLFGDLEDVATIAGPERFAGDT